MNSMSLLKTYDEELTKFESYADVLQGLLSSLLAANKIGVHSLVSRVKGRESLSLKIKAKRYESLSEITDVVGLRVIVYFADDVDLVAKLVQDEFLIDGSNSVDKRVALDVDQFGYMSLHSIISLSESRSKLSEYERFAGLKAEVQVRSILQHAWAEIEHDIGYKVVNEIPRPIRRQFSRLSGLLELADDEFMRIRQALSSYEDRIESEIQNNPENTDLNRVSLSEFVRSDPLAIEIDEIICERAGFNRVEPTGSSIARNLEMLNSLGLRTIGDLKSVLQRNKENIFLRLADLEYEDVEEPEVAGGISLFYLAQVLASQLGSEAEIFRFLNQHLIGKDDQVRQEFSEYLLKLGRRSEVSDG